MRFIVVAKKTGISKDKKEWYCLVIFDNVCTALSTCFIKKSVYDLFDVNDFIDEHVHFSYDKQKCSYYLRISD